MGLLASCKRVGLRLVRAVCGGAERRGSTAERKAALQCELGSRGKHRGKQKPVVTSAPEGQNEAGLEIRARGQGTTIQDLDTQCLSRIMWHLQEEHMVCFDGPPSPNESLKACSLVCREWLKAASYAKKTLTLRGGAQVSALPKLLSRFPDLQGVQFRDVRIELERGRGAKTSGSLKKRGKRLPAASAGLCDLPLELLVPSCRRLNFLKLIKCTKVSDAGLNAVIRGCTALLSLQLEKCGGFSGAAFEGVQCQIQGLVLDSCCDLTSAGLKAAAAACPSLQTLCITNDGDGPDLSAGVEGFAKWCPGPVLACSCQITDSTLRNFVVGCRLLDEAVIYFEDGITDDGVDAFMTGLPSLNRVKLLLNRQLSRKGLLLHRVTVR
ncbi:hypothetical protein KFL_000110490 [Klebsormidium nitens]|uniref:F-box domain-containing protein n=1 Tax=Klebsormidium nitens TaxID=105231 RepID=A0A1Y1HL41_KLENI|nr:hypothetical protein KFL_000110490 [Klebsormidium nitens]|eukprot:GAQ78352.1 hypothetical protein KFL_000110490 [Klebsormidium nitens]